MYSAEICTLYALCAPRDCPADFSPLSSAPLFLFSFLPFQRHRRRRRRRHRYDVVETRCSRNNITRTAGQACLLGELDDERRDGLAIHLEQFYSHQVSSCPRDTSGASIVSTLFFPLRVDRPPREVHTFIMYLLGGFLYGMTPLLLCLSRGGCFSSASCAPLLTLFFVSPQSQSPSF